MEIHLKIIGSLLILLAFAHLAFPKYFNWKNELSTLSLINKQMMIIHTFFIALIVLLMGILLLNSTHELLNTTLGNTIILGYAIFWTFRLLTQFFGYSSKTWQGKKLETTIHVLFSLFWLYSSTIFWICYIL